MGLRFKVGLVLGLGLIGNLGRADYPSYCDQMRADMATFASQCMGYPKYSCDDPIHAGPLAYRVTQLRDPAGTITLLCEALPCEGSGWLWDGTGPYIGADCRAPIEVLPAALSIPEPTLQCGSIIQTSNQVVGEMIPLTGASFGLSYFSNWVVGRGAGYKVITKITGADIPTNATSYDVQIKDDQGSMVYSHNYGTTANQTYNFVWNGLDSSSVETWGTRTFSFLVRENATDISPETNSILTVGSLKAKKLGIGAWVPTIWSFYDFNSQKLYKGDGSIRNVAPVTDGSYYRVADEDGSLVYYFSSNGKIAYTKLGLTGTTIYTFSYDGSGRLSSIAEPFSRTTTFTRNGSGVLTSITAPNGAVTTISIGSNGYLASVTNPNSEVYSMTYVNSDGLLYTFTKPNSTVSTFSYDSDGNLTLDSHSSGHSTSLSRSNLVITSTSAEGRVTTNTVNPIGYEDEVLPSGVTLSHYTSDTYKSVDDPYTYAGYGIDYGDDPRFGAQGRFPTNISSNYFGTRTTTNTSTANLSSGTDPFSIIDLVNVSDVGNSEITSTYTGSTKTNVTETVLGRTNTTVIDTYQRPTSVQKGSLTATTFSYTNQLLTGIAQGSRSTSLAYNSTSKLLASITNPLSQVTSFTYNSAERLATKTLPDSRVISYAYDSDGNLTSLTPPSRPAHAMNFGTNEMISSYVPPTLSGVSNVTTSYSYNNDRQLTQISRPTGNTITFNYDTTSGLLTTITGAFGTVTYTYTNGLPTDIQNQNGMNYVEYYTAYTPTTTFLYDDSWNSIWTYTRSPDTTAGEKVAEEVYTGGNSGTQTIDYAYDDDEYLTNAGDITLSYNTPNGLLTGTVIGNVNDAYTYNSFGEVTGYVAKYNTTTIYSYSLTRDALGRVTQKVELLNGITSTFDYTYDSSGRLTQVNKNSSTDSTYSYDNNSNRTGGVIHGTTTSATYDNQDRITAYNLYTFTHNANGELTQKVNSGTSITTNFSYDEFSNLISTQIGSTTYSYGVDPLQRRYQKETGSTINKRYMYKPEGQLAGELDASNNLKKTFIYGTRANVPDYFIDDLTHKYRVITDHLGSVRLVVRVDTGTVAQRMEHDEFGRVLTDTSAGYQPFGFAGGLYDSDTKLVKFGARDYDPEIGRWLSKDPISFGGGDSNLFGYVANDPVNFVDPNGTDAWIEGPSGQEPLGHQSINIGDPKGEYQSYSLAYDFDWRRPFGGHVYPDVDLGGTINRFKKTTKEVDVQIIKQLNSEVGDQSNYFSEGACRGFSQKKFNAIPGLEIPYK